MPLRIVFMGTPDFAVPVLTALLEQSNDVAAVYTRAPRPAGRGMAMQPSPVENAARRSGISVLTPSSLRGENAAQQFAAHGADVAVVVAYGLLLPPPILAAPRLGCLNLHPSLLPRWRGAAPIQRSIMAGDEATGVAVMRMEEGLDTGPVAMTERVRITADMTAGDLHDTLATAGAVLMAQAVAMLASSPLTFEPQGTEGVTYARKIEKSETRIAWDRPARAVHNHMRGLAPFPGAWFQTPDGARVKVLRSQLAAANGAPGTILDGALTVACAEGAVRLVEVQRAGGLPGSAREFLNGARLTPGQRLL